MLPHWWISTRSHVWLWISYEKKLLKSFYILATCLNQCVKTWQFLEMFSIFGDHKILKGLYSFFGKKFRRMEKIRHKKKHCFSKYLVPNFTGLFGFCPSGWMNGPSSLSIRSHPRSPPLHSFFFLGWPGFVLLVVTLVRVANFFLVMF